MPVSVFRLSIAHFLVIVSQISPYRRPFISIHHDIIFCCIENGKLTALALLRLPATFTAHILLNYIDYDVVLAFVCIRHEKRSGFPLLFKHSSAFTHNDGQPTLARCH